MESLTRRTAPGMLRVGEDRLGSGVGLKLFASVLSSKTIDGMRKLFSAPAPPLAFYIAESGIAAWSCDKAMLWVLCLPSAIVLTFAIDARHGECLLAALRWAIQPEQLSRQFLAILFSFCLVGCHCRVWLLDWRS